MIKDNTTDGVKNPDKTLPQWDINRRRRQIARYRIDPVFRKTQGYRTRKSRLKKAYNLTPEVWEKLYNEQGQRCAICEEPFVFMCKAHVDHDHKTGRVRGLLCSKCNNGLGLFRDNPKLMAQAIGYLMGKKVKIKD